MSKLEMVLLLIIALEHIYIAYIEMFAWEKMGNKIVPSAEKGFLKETKALAENQGLYNLFLAGGMIWSICIYKQSYSENIAYFFLACVIVAGIFGALRAEKTIFFKQALPASIVLGFILFL